LFIKQLLDALGKKRGAPGLHNNRQKLYTATSEDTTNEAIHPKVTQLFLNRSLSTTTTALSKAQKNVRASRPGHMVSWLTPLPPPG
jgi:hypothetical protein